MTKKELFERLGPIEKFTTISNKCVHIKHTNGKSLYCYDHLVAFQVNDFKNIFLTEYYQFNIATSRFLTDWCNITKEKRDKMMKNNELFLRV